MGNEQVLKHKAKSFASPNLLFFSKTLIFIKDPDKSYDFTNEDDIKDQQNFLKRKKNQSLFKGFFFVNSLFFTKKLSTNYFPHPMK